MSEVDRLTVIEHPWTIMVCPRCNRVKEASMGCTGAHESAHPYERMVRVEVVPHDTLQGAVAEAQQAKHEAYRLRALMGEAAKQDPVTCRKWIADCLAAHGGQ